MEVIERLKEKLAAAKSEPNTLKWMDILQQIGALVMDHQDAIIAALDASEHNAKCVQFAEDVKKLESRCENIRLSKNGGSWYLDADVLEGPNIHSVAMNQGIMEAVSEAVESLEKGEG